MQELHFHVQSFVHVQQFLEKPLVCIDFVTILCGMYPWLQSLAQYAF